MQRYTFIGMLMLILSTLLLPLDSSTFFYGREICHAPGMRCVRVQRGDSWQRMWPDVNERNMVMRLNRMNTQIYSNLVIAVPESLENSHIMDFSPLPKNIPAPNEKLIVIDPVNLAWGAYTSDGALVRWGPISAGADYCDDVNSDCRTHKGTFRIFSLGSSDCYSTKFPLPDGGAPMPYCMYFNEGEALHGEPRGLPGYNASHGCVRMYVNDAQWLRYDFVEGPSVGNNYRGTKVIVQPYD